MATQVLPAEQTTTRFLWLDLTRQCQLECKHCFNESGPSGTHGSMSRENWISSLDQAAVHDVKYVQFIGGEPTMHPDFAELVDHALNIGMSTEVYSNLVHVSPKHWELFRREGCSIATSYYAAQAGAHNAMTKRRSHARTRTNIEKAVQLGIPLRAGIVGDSEQQIAEARRDLESLGVTRIGVDHVRPFGRAAHNQIPRMADLCGACGSGAASIGPDGEVSPCCFSTWIKAGNVRDTSLAAILNGNAMAEATEAIRVTAWGKQCSPDKQSQPNQPCQPDCVPKNPCDPRCEPNSACRPGTPSTECRPRN
ncbi:radical SAM protein [Streptomyces griseocarneus]|nr:radical SAM protein [Streptomyces griseocarneus]